MLLLSAGLLVAANPAELPALRVSDNQRFLVTAQGEPFFWLADTAWWIRRLPPDDLAWYLDRRAEQGFTVLQVHVGWDVADYAGRRPFADDDPSRPDEAFWRHVDALLDAAAQRGLYIALVPMWGGEYGAAFGDNTDRARRFGAWIGARYADRGHVCWVVSGEYDQINGFRFPITDAQRAVLDAVADGLRSAHGGRQLMTMHPGAARTSALEFHGATWLDLNLLQSGHLNDCRGFGQAENHELIAAAFALQPTKPVLDGEPIYEDTPDGVWQRRGRLDGPRADAAAVRRKAYWAVFAGACGHTYGHNDVYAFHVPARPGDIAPPPGQRGHWRDAVAAPGGGQMRHLRRLIESRPMLERVPDPGLIPEPGQGLDHAVATRAADGSYAFCYSPRGKPIRVDLGRLSGPRASATWYDPRTGATQAAGEVARTGIHQFTPPSAGDDQDWVLILDDPARGFGPP